MVRKVAVIVFLTASVLVMGAIFSHKAFRLGAVTIRGETLKVEIAQTPKEKERGLSGKLSLPKDLGMLFVFDEPGIYGFWMKDMNFPIDIIWISQDSKIIDISPDILPSTFPDTFSPKLPAKYVLEVNAGWAEQHKVTVEDGVKF